MRRTSMGVSMVSIGVGLDPEEKSCKETRSPQNERSIYRKGAAAAPDHKILYLFSFIVVVAHPSLQTMKIKNSGVAMIPIYMPNMGQ